MIVTCEKCGARYKLEDSKVTGRGAKITCPRCRHMFVVFREEGGARPEPPRSGGPVTLPPTQMPPVPPPTQPIRAPGRDVNALDFRRVGISSWKVKVKIGLIYDFSDFRTLRKYIQDGRVTASDLLSHDGKNWTPIGDIPDLERHFIAVFEAAEQVREREEMAPPPEPSGFEDESPTNILGMSNLAASIADNLAIEAAASMATIPSSRVPQPTRPPTASTSRGNTLPPLDRAAMFGEPAEAPAARPRNIRSDTRPPVPAKRPEVNVVAIVGVLAIVGALGAWWFLNRPAPAPIAPPPVAAATPSSDADQQVILARMRADTRNEIRKGMEETSTAEPINVPEEKPMIPVRPKDQRPVGAVAALPPLAPTPSAAVTAKASTAQDYAAAGDDAWGRGDWAGAVAAYRDAARLDPGSASIQGRLGRAQYKSGDFTNAKISLTNAQHAGYIEASKWLGDIARDQGDTAGAIGHYNDYLKGGPSDAADIQREIEKLSGG